MQLPIRVLNVCGSVLFTFGTLLYIQSVVLSEGERIRVTIRTTSLMVAVATAPGRLSQDQLKEHEASAHEATVASAEMNSTRNWFLAQAVVGAGLVCLRERKD
jgi:predicted DNA-binding antitoxin AbrB/MazE fold protein